MPHHRASRQTQRLRHLIARCFPADSRIIAVPYRAGVVFAIAWRVRTDPERPNKRSKIVRLSISPGVVDQMNASNEDERQAAERRVESAIKVQLRAFEADHTAMLDEDPPVIAWTIEEQRSAAS